MPCFSLFLSALSFFRIMSRQKKKAFHAFFFSVIALMTAGKQRYC